LKVAVEEKIEESCSKFYTLKEVKSRIVKYFLDIIILIYLGKNNGLSGYDIIELVQDKYGQSLSPGTVYSILYSIERKGLIKGNSDGRKTIYALTAQGKESLADILNCKQELTEFMNIFFSS
jgi:DNA-binding PadR family transcriptional regulator